MMHRVILSIVAVLFAAATWVGYQAWHVYRAIHETTGVVVPRPTTEPTVTIPPLDSNRRINVLVLGSDNDRKREEASPLTQSIIVVTIDPLNRKVGMLSVPRDFYVPIRGHGMAKIDLAHKYGGVQLIRETVEKLFHIPIHYYAWVGLNGFIRVIDTFNGITLDAVHPVLDDFYPNDVHGRYAYGYKRVFIPAGWQHMTGDQALEYVRSRHGDLTGDFSRSARQQQVLVQLEQKINAKDVLFNLPQLADDLSSSVRTDLSLMKLYQLEGLARQIHRGDVTQVVLNAPTYCTYGWTPDGQSILQPNWPRIWPVVHRMFAPIVRPVRHAASRPASAGSRVPRSSPTAGPTRVPTARPAAPGAATPVPTPKSLSTPTPGPPTLLPGNLIFVRGGNLFELTRIGSIRQLTWQGDGAMPDPSPNGRSIAFVRFTTGFQRYGKYASDVWVLDLPTMRQHSLTHDETANPPNNLWALWPSWTSDGKYILFSSDRAKLSTAPSDVRKVDLDVWSMKSAGGTATKLTTSARGSGGDTEPKWRFGAHQFLYARWSYLQGTNQPYSALVLHDTRSGRSWQLTPAGGRAIDPEWDRKGNRIVYVSRVNGVDDVVVSRVVATKNGPALGPGTVLATGQVAQPAFSPDGRWVSYLRAHGDGFDFFLVPSSGGSAHRVDAVPSTIDARWRPVWTR